MTNKYRVVIDAILDGDTDEAVLMLIKLERKERDSKPRSPMDVDVARWADEDLKTAFFMVRDELRRRKELVSEYREHAKDSLPPMVKTRASRPKPLEHKCPTCGAKPGKPCLKPSNRGAGDAPIGQPLAGGHHHKARRVLAGGK